MSIPQPPYPTCPTTKIIEIIPTQVVAAKMPVKSKPVKIDRYRYINIYVEAISTTADPTPVDLGVEFALDSRGKMGTRCYVNLEANLPSPQTINRIFVSGKDMWLSDRRGCYIARFPVMGPYIGVTVYNQGDSDRKITVWAYLVS